MPFNSPARKLTSSILSWTLTTLLILSGTKIALFLGDIDVVTDTLAQGYDVSGNQNDMRLKAIRPAAVYFDTSIHVAVRIDLTA